MNIENIINRFISENQHVDISKHFNVNAKNKTDICKSINAAFIIQLCGEHHRNFSEAGMYLKDISKNKTFAGITEFYLEGLKRIKNEIAEKTGKDKTFTLNIEKLNKYLETADNINSVESIDAMWSVFFPEAVGVFNNKKQKSEELRAKRVIKITEPNPEPLINPGKQIIFTSNILLTIPPPETKLSALGYSDSLIQGIQLAEEENQIYFYDHPIQIGTPPEANEIIYGLKGLENTAIWEKEHNNMERDQKLTVLLSVSVTHKGLHQIAKKYIKETLDLYSNFKHLDIYIFTENDTEKIINNVFIPISKLINSEKTTIDQETDSNSLKNVFGVDGEYGRHYSFLKAIAAFWNIMIDNDKTATFKIDLDQVFPEKELKEQTGKSAFDHFKTPLWGAYGIDSFDNKTELGMIAGALVNEKDIEKGIYTPDVDFDDRKNLNLEERFFYSKLMMGLSTNTELTTRYGKNDIDGIKTCIQRIHVTGGTNGILIKSLKKHRPFTPSFIGRAEDQAYILSVMGKFSSGLAYLHEDGLIMRHDKEAFAQEAIKAASTGNMIGDFIRILYFSRYAEILSEEIETIKEIIDPFTGCFVSKIPITTVILRFCMKAADLFNEGKDNSAAEFMLQSYRRLERSIEFAYGENDLLQEKFYDEKKNWNYYYDLLREFEKNDPARAITKVSVKIKAAGICAACRV